MTKFMKLPTLLWLWLVCGRIGFVLAQSTQPTSADYQQLARQMQGNLQTEILNNWFPRAVDEKGGGFFQDYRTDWSPGSGNARGVVYQSRLTWTAAQAATRFPVDAKMYTSAAEHGLDFLSGKLWDADRGGFFWSVDVAGKPIGRDGDTKQAYGNAFAIYAASAVYAMDKNPAALDLARKGFKWYDDHGHDAANGGYIEVLSPDGKPNQSTAAAVGGVNLKSMNTSIHVLEALTALYEVWPDPLLKTRLQEMYEICRDKLVADPGYLIQFFSADWKPRVTDDSYGHDVEAAYLLVEAARALGVPKDPKAWAAGRKLVDHAIKVGLNPAGGLYESGNIDGGNYGPRREWWVQAEFLNALLLMHQRYGQESPIYWQTFIAQWNWINDHGIDHTHRGWWPKVNNDNTPAPGPKSDAWTECYHQGRAMMTIQDRLNHLAAAK